MLLKISGEGAGLAPPTIGNLGVLSNRIPKLNSAKVVHNKNNKQIRCFWRTAEW